MIKAKKNKYFNVLFRLYIKRLFRKHYFRIHLAGADNLAINTGSKPIIFYANHNNWWDGFTAYYLSNIFLKMDDFLMMDIEQMKKYSMFKYVGVFSVNRSNPREAVSSIEYSANLLRNTNRCLWIFPEGKMNVQDHEPVKFYSGISKIAEKTGGVILQPVAFRYEFIDEQRPEIFIQFGRGDVIETNPINTKDLTEYLCNKLNKETALLRNLVKNKQLDGFKVIFHGKESRNKTVERITA